ncbi:hypothetical protein P8X24_08030 [Pyrococcus kukulkanii]|uniref:hypothetical protein n=1 Tax=Pyrococcus kukulkanii TaxID=1609559 RepID=UPI003569D3FA
MQASSQVQIDEGQYKTIARFLNYLFGSYVEQGLGDKYAVFVFRYFGDDEKVIEQIKQKYKSKDGRTFHKFISAEALVKNAGEIAKWLYEMSKAEFDVYIAPILSTTTSRKSEHMLKLTQFIVIDIDCKKLHQKEQDKRTLRRIVDDLKLFDEVKKHAKALSLAISSLNLPAVVVFSGGGVHVWIKLSKLESFEKVREFAVNKLARFFEEIASNISKDLEVDTSVYDASRVLRAIGTLNNKYMTVDGERLKIRAEVVRFDDRAIDFEELQKIVDNELAKINYDEEIEKDEITDEVEHTENVKTAKLSETRVIAVVKTKRGLKKFVYNLSDVNIIKFKRRIANVLEGRYIRGRRHNTTLAYVGVLYKRGLPKELAKSVVEYIVAYFNDEEEEDRLECVESTYSKNPEKVATYKILRKEAKFTEEEAKAIIRDLLDAIEHYLVERAEIIDSKQDFDKIELAVDDGVVIIRVGKKVLVFGEDEFVRKKRVNDKIKLSISSKALAEVAISRFGLSDEIEVTNLEKELLALYLDAKSSEKSDEDDYIEQFNAFLIEIVKGAEVVETTFKEDEVNSLVKSNAVVRVADADGKLKVLAVPSALVVKFALDKRLKNFAKEFNKLAKLINLLAGTEIIQKKKKKGGIRYYYIRCDNDYIDREALESVLNHVASESELYMLLSNPSREQEEQLAGGDEL